MQVLQTNSPFRSGEMQTLQPYNTSTTKCNVSENEMRVGEMSPGFVTLIKCQQIHKILKFQLL